MELVRIIQSGDAVDKAAETPSIRADELLSEISRLYVDRCKAMGSGNTIALELFNKQIAELKLKLLKI